jgi:hypothetical protein
MPTLTQGNSASVSVSSGHYVALKNAPTANARIEFAGGVPCKVGHNGSNVYGPFAAQTVKISAVAGSVDYSTGALGSIRPMGRM